MSETLGGNGTFPDFGKAEERQQFLKRLQDLESLGARPAGVCVCKGENLGNLATGQQGSSIQLQVFECDHVCMITPSATEGLQCQGLVCPGARNRGDWEPGTATGQTECQSPASEEGPCYTYVDTYLYSCA